MKHKWIFYLRLFLSAIIVMILTIWLVKMMQGDIPLVDQWSRGYVETVAHTNIYSFFRWITNFGSKEFLVPFTVVMSIVLLWMLRYWLPSIVFSGGTLTSHLLNVFIKEVVARERPRIFIEANAEGYSFPSGHAMISMVCYGLLIYFLVRHFSSNKTTWLVQIGLSLFIFLIGISRYVINVHYLTDVLSGFVVGYFALLAIIYVYEKSYYLRKSLRKEE